MPASQLQDLLIDIHAHLLENARVDLNDSHELYEEARRKADGLRELRRAENDIRSAVDAHQTRRDLRGELVWLWHQLREHYEDASARLTSKAATLEQERDSTTERLETTRKELQTVRKEKQECVGDLSVVRHKLDELDAKKLEYETFDAESTREQIAAHEDQIEQLTGRIHRLIQEGPERVDAEIARHEETVAHNRHMLDSMQDLTITWLRSTDALTDDQLQDVARLLNPRLLEMSLESGVELSEPDHVVERLRKLAKRFDADGYRDDDVAMRRDTLPSVSINDIAYAPDDLRDEIEEAKGRAREVAQDSRGPRQA